MGTDADPQALGCVLGREEGVELPGGSRQTRPSHPLPEQMIVPVTWTHFQTFLCVQVKVLES